MLIEFSVGNYRSFKDVVRFSMVATKVKAQSKVLDENNVANITDELRLLKSAAIYGANSSGKSNLIQALVFMTRLVRNSSKDTQASEAIEVEPFRLSVNTKGKPSFFEAVFLIEDKQYRYGFEVDTQKVVSEWLFHVPTIKEAKLFSREDGNISMTGVFKEGKGLVEKTRDNALFLSVVAQFNGKIAEKVLKWFSEINVLSGLQDMSYLRYTIRCLQKDRNREDILRFVRNLDLSIDDIQVEDIKITSDSLPKDMPEELKNILLSPHAQHTPSVRTIHRKYDSDGEEVVFETFDMNDNESQGTAKLFALAGPLIDTLKKGKVLVIDELDARLHPLITLAIIELFNSGETNPKNAQLIFTTHDTNLLSNKIFRRDQVWFTEKSSRGETTLYSLVEYKYQVRNDASFESDYIKGRYGAIPFIGDSRRLLEVSDE